MKHTLKDRIIEWMGAISCTEANTIANRLLGDQRKHCNRLIFSLHEERAKAKGLQRRVDELEPALAECVAGLRKLSELRIELSAFATAARCRETANETLDRLQIPDDHLPTKGYPKEKQNGPA